MDLSGIQCEHGTSRAFSYVYENTMKPLVELFVKASATDGGEKGACPFSQKWFMIFYTLVERQIINLRIIAVTPSNPPPEFTNLQIGRRLPAVAVYNEHEDGVKHPESQPSSTCSGNDELEEIMRREYGEFVNVDADGQWAGADFFRNLNNFLRNGAPQVLMNNLSELDSLLKTKNTIFIENDEVGYSDCIIACKLQHIRVAGAFYQNLQIPLNLTSLWKYLERIYSSHAFEVSCPKDRDIILYHFNKIDFINDDLRRNAQKAILGIAEDQRSISIPDGKRSGRKSIENLPSVRLSIRSSMQVNDFDEAMRQHYSSGSLDSPDPDIRKLSQSD